MQTGTTARTGEAIGWCPQVDEEHRCGAETILFVEDETFVRDVTCEVLRAAGYEVLTAQNASEATRLYEQHLGGIDLLLTDLVLPGETGRQLAARLAQGNLRLKILFVTGYAEQMKMSPGQECLPKPFSTPALLARVRQVLDRQDLAEAG